MVLKGCKGEERIHGHRWWSTRWDDPHSIIGKTAYEGISGGIDVQGDEGLSESEDEEEPSGNGAGTCTPPGEDDPPQPCPVTSRAQCPHVGRLNRAAHNNNLHLQRDPLWSTTTWVLMAA